MEPRKKILLIEDNEIDRQMLETVLVKKNYDVVTLDDGSSCLDAVATHNPDLVLLDVLMPGMAGNQALRLLREKYSPLELPILMTTIKSQSSDIVQSLEIGANDYLVKPIDFDVALTRIQTHLDLVRLSKELSQLRSLEKIAALVATYNHEINNPLAIAISSLNGLSTLKETKGFIRLEEALWRIADIVKRMKEVTENPPLELQKYGESLKTIKLK